MVSVLGAVVVVGPLLWMRARSRHGLPPRTRIIRQAFARQGDGARRAAVHDSRHRPAPPPKQESRAVDAP